MLSQGQPFLSPCQVLPPAGPALPTLQAACKSSRDGQNTKSFARCPPPLTQRFSVCAPDSIGLLAPDPALPRENHISEAVGPESSTGGGILQSGKKHQGQGQVAKFGISISPLGFMLILHSVVKI